MDSDEKEEELIKKARMLKHVAINFGTQMQKDKSGLEEVSSNMKRMMEKIEYAKNSISMTSNRYFSTTFYYFMASCIFLFILFVLFFLS